jgi:hypothetical protein
LKSFSFVSLFSVYVHVLNPSKFLQKKNPTCSRLGCSCPIIIKKR